MKFRQNFLEDKYIPKEINQYDCGIMTEAYNQILRDTWFEDPKFAKDNNNMLRGVIMKVFESNLKQD